MKRLLLLLILLPTVTMAAESTGGMPGTPLPMCALCNVPNLGLCQANYGVSCKEYSGLDHCTAQQAYCYCPGWAAATGLGPYSCP